MITYNNILKKFEIIAVGLNGQGGHSFIQRFGSGQITDIDAIVSNSALFPMLWIIPQSTTVEENTLSYTFRVMVFDIDSQDDSKQQEILSDTLRTLTDVIKVLRFGDAYLEQYDLANDIDEYNLELPVECFPFSQRFVDYVSGWYADIKIITEFDNSICDVPWKN